MCGHLSVTSLEQALLRFNFSIFKYCQFSKILLKFKIASGYVQVYFSVGHKDSDILQNELPYSKEYLHAKCQVSVPMHKEKTDESSRRCDLGL